MALESQVGIVNTYNEPYKKYLVDRIEEWFELADVGRHTLDELLYIPDSYLCGGDDMSREMRDKMATWMLECHFSYTLVQYYGKRINVWGIPENVAEEPFSSILKNWRRNQEEAERDARENARQVIDAFENGRSSHTVFKVPDTMMRRAFLQELAEHPRIVFAMCNTNKWLYISREGYDFSQELYNENQRCMEYIDLEMNSFYMYFDLYYNGIIGERKHLIPPVGSVTYHGKDIDLVVYEVSRTNAELVLDRLRKNKTLKASSFPRFPYYLYKRIGLHIYDAVPIFIEVDPQWN